MLLSIVLCTFLSVIRSPERSRLYYSVYPLFSSELLLFDTTTSHCTSLPVIFPPRLPRRFFVAASGCFRSSSFSSTSLSIFSTRLLFPFVSHGVTLLSQITRKAFIFYRSTAVECILYTFLQRDILVLLYGMRKCIIYIKKAKQYIS